MTLNNQTGVLIALEGSPGAGKTSIWNQLRSEFQFALPIDFAPVLLEPSEWATHDKYTDSVLISKIDEWYLEQEVQRALTLGPILTSGRHVIQDRSFLSTLCFAFARSSWLNDFSYFRSLEEIYRHYDDKIIKPNFVINLSVTPTISKLRVKSSTPRAVGPWDSIDFLIGWHKFSRKKLKNYLPSITQLIDLKLSDLNLQDTYQLVRTTVLQILGKE